MVEVVAEAQYVNSSQIKVSCRLRSAVRLPYPEGLEVLGRASVHEGGEALAVHEDLDGELLVDDGEVEPAGRITVGD